MSLTDEGHYGPKQLNMLEVIWGKGYLSPGGPDEIDQIKRLCQFMYKSSVGNVEQNRFDFGKFITEYDKRRNTNFGETFPELVGYYNLCKGTQWPTKSI